MITYWVVPEGSFGIQDYLGGRGAQLRDRFAVRLYEWTEAAFEVAAGVHVFSAIDQLSEPERQAMRMVRAQLAAKSPQSILLNDPARCLLRPDFLATLADAGVNGFRAYPAGDHTDARFPVFVRGAHNHDGSLTPLLRTPGELGRTLLGLRMRGYALADLLVVEFCDTADAQGIFRKYSAYRVGGAVVPAHVMAGRSWLLKSESAERTLETVREDAAYVETNPHADWIRRVFDLAGIEFGRLDYGVREGVPQAWEINLNPTMGRRSGRPRREMDPAVAEVWDRSRQLAHAQLRAAFAALDRPGRGETVTLRLDGEARAAIVRARRKSARSAAALRLLGRAYHSPLGAPLRAVTRLIRASI